jgi:uroporphyrinogen-III synthase
LSGAPGDGAPRPAPAAPLDGATVVVTRPLAQSRALAERIAAAGGVPWIFPAFEIADPPHAAELRARLARLGDYDLAVFVSPTAVERGLRLVPDPPGWPAALRPAAVGAGTARALARHGIGAPIVPDGPRFDSEALLALPALADLGGRRVLLFRGEGGRELIARTLAARGATVEHAVCYRRALPRLDAQPLLAALAAGTVAAVIVTSAEALRNLLELAGPAGRATLLGAPLVTIHERIAAEARRLGAARVAVSAAGDEALVAAVVALRGAAGAQTERDPVE